MVSGNVMLFIYCVFGMLLKWSWCDLYVHWDRYL